jgi:hypothetical protein
MGVILVKSLHGIFFEEMKGLTGAHSSGGSLSGAIVTGKPTGVL